MKTGRAFAIVFGLAGILWAQQPSILPESENPTIVLHPSSAFEVPMSPVGGLIGSIRCDSDGSFYVRPEFGELTRISKDGKNVVRFRVNAAPNAPRPSKAAAFSGDFNIGPDGSVYTSIRLDQSVYVVKFDSEGQYRSRTKLDVPDYFTPANLAVFSNDTYLVSGVVPGENVATPSKALSAIFDDSGRIVAELTFKGDTPRSAHQSKSDDSTLSYVTLGSVVTLDDGNAYLMRRFRNPLVYVLSARGRLLRVLKIRSPEGFEARSMKGADGRLIFTFQKHLGETVRQLFIVYDTIDGHEVARYERGADLSGAFVCYSEDELTFLGVREGKRVIIHARP